MNPQEFDQLVNIIYSSGRLGQNPPSNEQINEANAILYQIQNNIEGLIFIISNFTSFKSDNSLILSLIIIGNWLKYESNLNKELVEQVHKILFEYAIADCDDRIILYTNTLAKTQLAFMIATYPQVYSDFWVNLLKLPKNIVFQFLSIFTEYSTIDNEKFNEILNYMIIDGSDVMIVEYAIEGIKNKSEIAFNILQSLMGWVNLEPILESGVLDIIIQEIYNPDLTIEVINIISMLINGISSDDVSKIIQGIDIERVITVLRDADLSEVNNDSEEKCKRDINEALLCFGNLICKAGTRSEFSEQIYRISISFLIDDNDLVSESVLQLIQYYVEKQNSFANEILPKATYRLAKYLETNPDIYQMDRYISELLKTLFIVAKVNIPVFVDFIVQVFNNVQDNLYLQAAALLILVEMNNNYFGNSYPQELVTETVLPFSDKYLLIYRQKLLRDHYLALASFIDFFIMKRKIINNIEIYQKIFAVLCYYCVFDNNTDENERFISHLNKFINFPDEFKFLQITPDIILSFIKSHNLRLYPIASKLLQLLPKEEKSNITKDIFEYFLQIINEIENKFDFLTALFNFFKEYKVSSKDDINLVLEFYRSIFQYAQIDDSIFSLYISTIYTSLKEDGFSYFLEIINYVQGMESISSAFEVSLNYFNNDKLNTGPLINQIMSLLLPKSEMNLKNITEWHESSEECKEWKSLSQYLFIFASLAVQYLSNDIIKDLFNLISVILNSYNIVTQLQIESIPSMLDFIISLPTNWFNEEGFVIEIINMTFNIIRNETFNSRIPKWRFVCLSIIKLHLLLAQHETASSIFFNLISSLLPSELFEQYKNMLIHLNPTKELQQYTIFYNILHDTI